MATARRGSYHGAGGCRVARNVAHPCRLPTLSWPNSTSATGHCELFIIACVVTVIDTSPIASLLMVDDKKDITSRF